MMKFALRLLSVITTFVMLIVLIGGALVTKKPVRVLAAVDSGPFATVVSFLK
ncbi:hypothetical protein BsIDN1_26670 [Bacillus safensis]|uniref:Uncharacterized protein n=1 Tax=Bacillus safensis TaxID=561879 RepID=A0A5S9MAS1_BACIA|nr:hypothetical protein BsIDN1_26670 [Bacillus safensis]